MGAGLGVWGWAGNPIGSDFSPGSSARLPPHSCPLPLLLLARRSVPVLRPHSWHMAKLAEIRPDAPAMHCPPDAFSLSWPSGCDVR